MGGWDVCCMGGDDVGERRGEAGRPAGRQADGDRYRLFDFCAMLYYPLLSSAILCSAILYYTVLC